MTKADEIPGVQIEGLAAYVPPRSVANDANVAKATGIAARRVADDGDTALCYSIVLKIANRQPM